MQPTANRRSLRLCNTPQHFSVLPIHCWLEDVRNSRKNVRGSQIYFWYLWVFLSWPQVKIFLEVFGHQVVPPSLLLKIEILCWIFLWWIPLRKKWSLGDSGSIFCINMAPKCSKTWLILVAIRDVKQSSFWAFLSHFWTKDWSKTS